MIIYLLLAFLGSYVFLGMATVAFSDYRVPFKTCVGKGIIWPLFAIKKATRVLRSLVAVPMYIGSAVKDAFHELSRV